MCHTPVGTLHWLLKNVKLLKTGSGTVIETTRLQELARVLRPPDNSFFCAVHATLSRKNTYCGDRNGPPSLPRNVLPKTWTLQQLRARSYRHGCHDPYPDGPAGTSTVLVIRSLLSTRLHLCKTPGAARAAAFPHKAKVCMLTCIGSSTTLHAVHNCSTE